MNLYEVTFRFNLPIRPDITVNVKAKDETALEDTAHIEAERIGVIFGLYAYKTVPQSIKLIKENI